jgi:uncharacterized protein (DUF433 family)
LPQPVTFGQVSLIIALKTEQEDRAMKKITLEQLIEQDLLQIPEPDMTFILTEVTGINHLGLKDVGGVYLFKDIDTDEVIYVGVSRNLGHRMYIHLNNHKQSGNIVNKILKDGIDKSYLNKIEVSIILEPKEIYQDIMEKFLINKYNFPKYNEDGKQGGRGCSKGVGAITLPVEHMAMEYQSGLSIQVLADKYNVSYETIRRHLKKAGVQLRPKSITLRAGVVTLPVEQIAMEYQSGLSIHVLSNKYNVAPETIRKYLKKAGVQLRQVGRPKGRAS